MSNVKGHGSSMAALRTLWVVSTLAFLVSAAGCASLSEQQCKDGDWEAVGYSDGVQGQTPEYRLAAHRRACEQAGISPNRTAYMVGWKKGVPSYCSPESGFEVGARGAMPNEKVCPAQLAGGFLSSYRSGRQVYDLQSEASRLQSDIRKLERQLDDRNLSPSQRGDIRGKILNREDALAQIRPLLFAAQSRPVGW